MSQHDFNIANQTFPSFRADLNDALQASATMSAGSSAPTTPYAYQLWFDTTTDTWKVRNSGNTAWISTITTDLATGNVGINNTSPASYYSNSNQLVVGSGAARQGITIASSTSTIGQLAFADGTSGDARYEGWVIYDHNTDHMSLGTSAEERMRITDAGTILVGKQAENTANDGIELNRNDVLVATRNNDAPLLLNRRSSDGDIAVFRKDNTTVGSIGTSFGYIWAGTGDVGLSFRDTLDSINPFNPSAGNNRDNAIDLGHSATRFKDLYLSGGVYLGGTGSANYLDDYEYGTWTPSLTASTTNPTYTLTNSTAHYVKIGDMVYFSWYSSGVNISSSGSGNAQVDGLPYTSANGTEEYWLFNYKHGTAVDTTGCSGGYVAKNDTRMVFVLDGYISSPSWATGNGKYLMVAGAYRTTA